MLELARRTDEPPIAGGNRTHDYLAALEQKVLWLACWMIHNANHIRPSRDGLKVGGHQASCASVATLITSTLPGRAAAGRPGRGQAARQPDVPRDPVSARPAKPRKARALSRLRRRPGLSVAHQGQRRRRFLHGLGRARRRDDPVRLADPGPPARAPAGAGGPAQGPHGRDRRRRRARRGQRLRGPARGLEARRPQRLVGDRLQPPEPGSGRARAPVQEDRGLLRRGRLAGRDPEVRQAAGGGLRPARRPGLAPMDRRLSERPLLGDHLQGRQRLAPASRARPRPSGRHPDTARRSTTTPASGA